MKVKCVIEPPKELIERNITVGKVYDVVEKDDNDYRIIDDNNELWYFTNWLFEEINE